VLQKRPVLGDAVRGRLGLFLPRSNHLLTRAQRNNAAGWDVFGNHAMGADKYVVAHHDGPEDACESSDLYAVPNRRVTLADGVPRNTNRA
jgi:hypothetical protein